MSISKRGAGNARRNAQRRKGQTRRAGREGGGGEIIKPIGPKPAPGKLRHKRNNKKTNIKETKAIVIIITIS